MVSDRLVKIFILSVKLDRLQCYIPGAIQSKISFIETDTVVVFPEYVMVIVHFPVSFAPPDTETTDVVSFCDSV